MLALIAVAILGVAPPAQAVAPAQPLPESYVYGQAFDAVTRQPLANVCVILGPALVRCATRTDVAGNYRIDFPPGDVITSTWTAHFLHREAGYRDYDSPQFVVRGATRIDAQLARAGSPMSQPCTGAGTATQSLYLPNITKTLGGPNGFQTPFIVQNTGTSQASIEVSFYRFSDGALVVCGRVPDVLPGTSFADVPNNDAYLPHDSQFSVVVRSFGAAVVAVVNQHQGSGERAEAMSYVGHAGGATNVYLPNITRRFFGYVTPFIIQNLGAATTVVSARFVSFDGTVQYTALRTIAAGRSQFVDPNSEPGLLDGTQYAVTVTASEPLAVVVNTHNDAATVERPVAYSANGLTRGGATVYGPYAAKNADGVGRLSTVVVQNLGTTAVSPTLVFTPLGNVGPAQTFTLPAIAPGSSRAFDPRFQDGDTARAVCGSAASASCLGDGDYSFVADAGTGQIAVVVNVISGATAMGYAASPAPASRYYLPNVTRTLGGTSGWTTPILLQAVTATGATLSWYRFSDGQLVHTQAVSIPAGTGVRIDPRTVSGLADDTQYSVVVDGTAGSVSAIVVELATGGDNAMIYEGFAAP